MANRCMLFAARALPAKTGDRVAVLALGEFGWDIPTLYKLLVSVNPQPCPSVVFGHEGPLAIAGDRAGGLDLLKTLRAKLPARAPAAAALDDAIATLSKAHIDHPYFLLEPGEILDLESGPLDVRLQKLLGEIESLKIDALVALAQKSAEARHWATESWSNILYFEPAGSERPPIDPTESFLSTGVAHLLEHRAKLPECRALNRVMLTVEDGAPDLAAAMTALGEVPGPFELTLYGQVDELPATVSALKNVTLLGLGSLGLRSLPDGLAGMFALTALYLQTNRLEGVPDCLRHLPYLKQLSLRQNPLQRLPAWIGELKELEHLWLDGCELAAVPKELWTLGGLTSLNLETNPRLGRLPDGIEGLSALEELNLYDCGLEALPDGVGKLARLKSLYIGNNKLTSLPDGLYGLRLDTLSLGGNPLRRNTWFGLWPARRFRAKKVHWR
jgi:hypothetical protein